MDFPKQFICATKEYAAYDRFVPAPYFRKVFTANAPDCRLRVTGLGFYRVWINGREITKGLLAPYISNPDDIIYFDDYDLSPYIIPDAENALGFQLGNGMLNAPGGATWDLDKAPYRAAPKLAFLLENGDIRTEPDSGVKTAPSPLYFDDLRAGVRYDARREIPGWSLPGFDDSGWAPALLCGAPRGKFRVCEAAPVLPTGEDRRLRQPPRERPCRGHSRYHSARRGAYRARRGPGLRISFRSVNCQIYKQQPSFLV